jgi:hypothetical protein
MRQAERFRGLWPAVFTGPVTPAEACARLGVTLDDLAVLLALGLLDEKGGTLTLPSRESIPRLGTARPASCRDRYGIRYVTILSSLSTKGERQ